MFFQIVLIPYRGIDKKNHFYRNFTIRFTDDYNNSIMRKKYSLIFMLLSMSFFLLANSTLDLATKKFLFASLLLIFGVAMFQFMKARRRNIREGNYKPIKKWNVYIGLCGIFTSLIIGWIKS